MKLATLGEYAALAGRSTAALRPPRSLGEGVRWLAIGLAVFLALRIVWGALNRR